MQGGEENAIIVSQLSQWRSHPSFAHCRDIVWEWPWWPGPVSVGHGGRNSIQGLVWVNPAHPPFRICGQQGCRQKGLCAGGIGKRPGNTAAAAAAAGKRSAVSVSVAFFSVQTDVCVCGLHDLSSALFEVLYT